MRASPHGHCDVIELIQVGPWPSSSSSSTGGSRGGDGAPSLAALSRYVKAFYMGGGTHISDFTDMRYGSHFKERYEI
jgi:hypothetical protein